jgi:uncharacterized protein with FMN-binding domain
VSKQRNNNLVALGSAAVLTVYAAGYLRTRSAAGTFADERAGRRHPASAPPVVAQALPRGTPVAMPAMTMTPPAAKPPVLKSAGAAPKKPKAAKVDSTPAVPTAASVDSATKAAADSAAKVAADRGPYKDGVYLGWGSSRHGDIQASVEIRNGHIFAATIAQCLTRYTCAWISNLPGQVVARQSPETDVISGATQSSDAFYYAVVEALKLAK